MKHVFIFAGKWSINKIIQVCVWLVINDFNGYWLSLFSWDESPERSVHQVIGRTDGGLLVFLFFCVFFPVGVVEGAEPEVWHQHQTGVWGGFGCFLLCASLLDDCSLISRSETHQIVFNCPVKPVKSVKAVHSCLFARQPCECLIFSFKQKNVTGSSFWLWTRSQIKLLIQ